MKKFIVSIVFVLAVLSALSVSAQSFDLSGLSYSDLQAVVAQAQKEMMTRPEFQSVEVPVGLYVVGREIPAGKWTIRMTNNWARIKTGSQLEANQMEIASTFNGDYWTEQVNDEAPERTVVLTEGMYIEIRERPVIFSTPTAPSFSFN